MGRKIRDLTGHKYNHINVIKLHSSTKKYLKWLCKCDCGKELVLKGTKITQGEIKSCGCSRYTSLALRNKQRGLPPGEAAFNCLYNIYKRSARKSNRNFDLSKHEFRMLTSDGCYYCDKPPSNLMHYKTHNGGYMYNGIDRVDNLLGYHITNCVTCCISCNKKKHYVSKNIICKAYKFFMEKDTV